MLAKSSTPPLAARTPRPGDATLSVTKAARVLGVHPNTVRAWSDAGRLRYYRINDRGDRRYRQVDLQRFLAAAVSGAAGHRNPSGPGRAAGGVRRSSPDADRHAGRPGPPRPTSREIASFPSGLDPTLDEACRRIRQATGAALVGIWERRPGGLVPRATDAEGGGATAARTVAPGRGLFSLALESSPRSMPGPACPARSRSSGWARTSWWSGSPVARPPGAPGPGGRDAARPRRRTSPGGRDRADAGGPHPGRRSRRAGVGSPPPVRGAATRRHGPRVEARRG